MSADGISALGVDDLGRNLMGWQLAGWQFEIPHDPLTVTFLEPGIAHAAAPQFSPIPSQAREPSTDTPDAADSPAVDLSSAPPAPGISPAVPPSAPSETPRDALSGSGSSVVSGPADGAGGSAIPAAASGGSVAASGGGAVFSGAPDAALLVIEDVADVFEFNVIFQMNVLLDGDMVAQEVASASDAGLYGLGFGQWAFTGGNAQSNQATIQDAGVYGDFGWLGGGYYETNMIYSLNALDDGDVAFNLVSGGGLDVLQSIASGGNTQINEAEIFSLTGGAAPVPEDVVIGPNDTVQYNMTAQVNFMNDADIVSQQIFGAGGGSGAQTVSTGGNSQTNTALLVDDNTAPDHAVPGNYYEYNIIVQANFMDDGDHVAQSVTADMPASRTAEGGFTADDEALPHGLYGDAIA